MKCNNYKGISLLNTTNMILTKIISKRLKPYIEVALGEYQYQFRRHRLTMENISEIGNTLEKCYV
jgi:hypothetical protein